MNETYNPTAGNPGTDTPKVTIKFGKGLVSEPFTTKSGKELVEVKIPNPDPNDKRPWESFVISPKMIHDNQFGKGVWMKLPEEGATTLTRNVKDWQDEKGRPIWKKETRTVTNPELKELMEAYKLRDRDSVLNNLNEKSAAAPAPRAASRSAYNRDAAR